MWIGIFICFTAKSMCWVVKEKGQSWDGKYFSNTTLVETVISFLKKRENVHDVRGTTFLHDKAPCLKSTEIKQLICSNKIDFFDNSQWLGYSPYLNAAENLRAILKDRVSRRLYPILQIQSNWTRKTSLKSSKKNRKTCLRIWSFLRHCCARIYHS